MNSQPSWDDLRVFLSVARTGSFSGAATALHSSQPTVGRCVRALEKAIGSPLVVRTASGVTLTAEGKALLPQIEEMERVVRRAVAPSTPRVRIAAGGWMCRFLARNVKALVSANVAVELQARPSTDAAQQSVSSADADLALLIALPPSGFLKVRQLARPTFAIYGRRGVFSEATPPWHRYPWASVEDAQSHLPSARWISRLAPGVSPGIVVTNALHLLDVVAAGAALGVLPRFVGDTEADLVRLVQRIDEPPNPIWLAVHEDRRRAPAVVETMKRLTTLFASERDRLEPP